MKDTELLSGRQIITGRVASPAIVAENISWVAMVAEYERETFGLSSGLELATEAMLNDVIDFNGSANIFFGDCDAGDSTSKSSKFSKIALFYTAIFATI
jgi:hypothetical protein